jgi:hypothetical protein
LEKLSTPLTELVETDSIFLLKSAVPLLLWKSHFLTIFLRSAELPRKSFGFTITPVQASQNMPVIKWTA